MKGSSALLLFASLFASCKAAFKIEKAPIIEIVGNKFFNSTSGDQFFIKGIAYQRARKPGELYDGETETAYVDSLANPAMCLRDLEYLKELGVNTVRVYQIDPNLNHEVCMNAFASQGIYVLSDLSEPRTSIHQDNPFWDVQLFDRYKAVVDSMHNFTNLLGFIAGNEVINNVGNSDAAAFVKASVRDIKAYIRDQGYRHIPVGYASADDTLTRLDSASYFVCGDNNSGDAAVDFYAINIFEWCGYSSYATSGYKERTIEFSQSPVPVFFSEFGCNAIRPRPFTEIDSIYGPAMSQVWSGGIVYEFFQNENSFGIVDENTQGHIMKLEEFNIVKLRLIEAIPKKLHRDLEPVPEKIVETHCPQISSSWNSSLHLPPTPDEGKCECLQATFSCIVTPYSKVDENALLKDVCSKTNCSEIEADGARGVYGRYSECSIRQRVSYALNKYWIEQKRKPESCDFDKRAVLISNAEHSDPSSVYTLDGRSCAVALGLEKQGPSDKGKADKPASTSHNYEDAQVVRMSSAQKPAQWGMLLMTVFIMSFMYFAT